MFKVGDKVICIDDSIRPNTAEEIKKDFVSWVKKDEEYTIRAIDDNKGIVTGVLLEEVVNPMLYFRLVDEVKEPMFASWRFRKLKYNTREATEEEYESQLIDILNDM